MLGDRQQHADELRYLVSTIVLKSTYHDCDADGFVRLQRKFLRNVISDRRISWYEERLQEEGIVEISPHLSGVRSRGFRLTPKVLADRPQRYRPVNPILRERIASFNATYADEQRDRRKPIHDRLEEFQRQLTICPSANSIVKTLPRESRLCQSIVTDDIRSRRFRFVVGTTGRVFNAIANLKRELRSELRLDGARLGEVDLRCAQPALLGLLITFGAHPDRLARFAELRPKCVRARLPGGRALAHISMPDPFSLCSSLPLCPPAELAVFVESVCGGGFYECLCQQTKLNRNTVKLAFLRDVLAKRGCYPSLVEDAFSSSFPGVFAVIQAVNRVDHCSLIRVLQRLESWLVIEKVAPKVVDRIPIVTLHDAIYGRSQDVLMIVDAFNETFDEIDFHIALKATPAK